MRKRRNAYGFLYKPVPDRLLAGILENATHVPSAGFTQDFDFVAVRDAALKRKLADAANESEYVRTGLASQNFISDAPVVVVPCGSKPRFEAKYGKPGEKTSRLPWWLIDAGFASFALILSAYEKGLAASFIGAIDDDKVARILHLPADNSIVPLAVIPLGYSSKDDSLKWNSTRSYVKRRRRKLDEFVHWDHW